MTAIKETVVKKRKRVSKKTKRAWRKHTDTKDVDKFLESERQQERLGSLTDRPDSELFRVDTEPKKTPKKLRREILKSKAPRCFEVLTNKSSVQDPIRIRNRVRTPEERKISLGTAKREAERKQKGILRLKEKLAIANKSLTKTKRLNRHKRGDYNMDAWEVSTADKKLPSDWMSTDAVRHTLKHIAGVSKRKLPISLQKKPSQINAVQPPHPGESYNPSYEDHQDLLRTIAEKEAEMIKKEKHLERVTSQMFKKVSVEEKQRNIMKEMSEGLDRLAGPTDGSQEEKENTVDADPVVRSVNPPVMNKKKTLVQRRKQREQKQLLQELRKAKLEKKKISDMYSLRKIQANLKSLEQKHEFAREKRVKKKKEHRETGPKVLSKTKFEPTDPDFKLAEELTGTLRGHEPAGSLLRDRFKSFQQRGILAPSQRKLKMEKAKVKRFIKPDHKIDVDAYLKSEKTAPVKER